MTSQRQPDNIDQNPAGNFQCSVNMERLTLSPSPSSHLILLDIYCWRRFPLLMVFWVVFSAFSNMRTPSNRSRFPSFACRQRFRKSFKNSLNQFHPLQMRFPMEWNNKLNFGKATIGNRLRIGHFCGVETKIANVIFVLIISNLVFDLWKSGISLHVSIRFQEKNANFFYSKNTHIHHRSSNRIIMESAKDDAFAKGKKWWLITAEKKKTSHTESQWISRWWENSRSAHKVNRLKYSGIFHKVVGNLQYIACARAPPFSGGALERQRHTYLDVVSLLSGFFFRWKRQIPSFYVQHWWGLRVCDYFFSSFVWICSNLYHHRFGWFGVCFCVQPMHDCHACCLHLSRIELWKCVETRKK